jgi:O-antigen ligase
VVSGEARAHDFGAASGWLRVCAATGVASAAAYLIVLPIGYTAALRSISLLLALMAAIVLWASRGPRSMPLLPTFAVWLLAASLSLVSTRSLDASLKAIDGEILRAFLVFFVFYTLSRRLALYRVWVAATALGFILFSALAIFSFYKNGGWTVPPRGDFATSAVTVLPLLLGYALLQQRERRLALLAGTAVVVTLTAAHLTFSRAFWLILVCGLLLGGILYARRFARVSKRLVVLVTVACIAALGLAAAVSKERGRSLIDISDRVVLYSAAAKKIAGNPLTGTGYGQGTDSAWYEAALPNESISHPHNIVLGYVDQMGIAGLVALLMIFGAPVLPLVRGLRAPPIEARTAALCGLVLLACVFVKNNLDYFFVKHNLWLFFAHLGIYLGEIDRNTLARPSRVV